LPELSKRAQKLLGAKRAPSFRCAMTGFLDPASCNTRFAVNSNDPRLVIRKHA
jgi:hypothetical protein